MNAVYYRSGQAATLLGISSHSIRRLCEAGLIEAELSDGGQWRVPASEIERLKREGVPPIPSSIEEDQDEAEGTEEDDSPKRGLLGPPSKEVVTSAEDVVVAENRLKKLKIDRETEETQDWFRHRAASEAEADERQWQAELEATARAEAEEARIIWEDKWLAIALAAVPEDAPPKLRLSVRESVTAALAKFGPRNSAEVIRAVVVAAVSDSLQPWLKQNETANAIKAACNALPWRATSYLTPTVWQVRANEHAAAAIRKLPWDCSYDEKVKAGSAAVQAICREFEDFEKREKIVHSFIWDLDFSQQEEAKEAIRIAFAKLPLGTGEKALERAREEALLPFREARKRRELEARHQQRVAGRLFHIRHYLQEMQEAEQIEFDNYLDLWNFVERITPRIRQAVLCGLAEQDLRDEEIDALIEELVEESLDD